MKRILSVFVLVAITMGTFAKDFNAGQLALRLNIFKFLSVKGMEPQIDEDGDIKFTKDNLKWYVILDELWSEPYLATLSLYYKYDDSGYYTKTNMENFVPVVAQQKAIKLRCFETQYVYQAQVICQDANGFCATLDRLTQEMMEARSNTRTLFEAGMAGMDMITDKNSIFMKALEARLDADYSKSFPLFRLLSNANYTEAYGYMGLAYEMGEGVDANTDLMVAYYQKAIDAGYNWCAYRLGNYYYDRGDYANALTHYVKCGSSENGWRSEALYKAGYMHERGEGTQRDKTQAINYYRKSVQYSRELECDARLALIEMGVTVDGQSEFVDASKTMLMGLNRSQIYYRGYEYENGLNDRYVSLPKAYAFYKAAAERDYTKAYTKMGEIYISRFYPFNDKTKSDKYYQKAFKAYKQKEETSGEACYELGRMYQNGWGVNVDQEQAKYYYKSGALLGDEDAAWRFGLICLEEMEYSEAYKFFLKAAEAGQGMAMYELARLLEEGMGVSKSLEKAVEWYEKCAKSSYKASIDARKALARLRSMDEKG